MVITAPASSDSDSPSGLAFAEGDDYLLEARNSGVGAVIVPLSVGDFPKPILKHSHPRMAFGHLLSLFDRPFAQTLGIHPSAIVDCDTNIDPDASIGAYVVIERGCSVAKGATIMPFSYLGENCTVGENSIVFPHAVLLRNITVGGDCEIGPGAILGHAGFGKWCGHPITGPVHDRYEGGHREQHHPCQRCTVQL